MVGLDVAPAILIPFYDEDSSTLFLTGKGDTTIYAYEVTEDSPTLCPLSHHRCSSLHQGLSFLPKNQCDVSSVEFAKSLRLTNNSVEPLSFTVPRLRTELFQDDLFPATRVTWLETIASVDWFALNDKQPLKVSLKPEGMEALSSIAQPPSSVQAASAKKNGTSQVNANQPPPASQWSSEVIKNKEIQLKNSVSAHIDVNLTLYQDGVEGVAEQEWEEE